MFHIIIWCWTSFVLQYFTRNWDQREKVFELKTSARQSSFPFLRPIVLTKTKNLNERKYEKYQTQICQKEKIFCNLIFQMFTVPCQFRFEKYLQSSAINGFSILHESDRLCLSFIIKRLFQSGNCISRIIKNSLKWKFLVSLDILIRNSTLARIPSVSLWLMKLSWLVVCFTIFYPLGCLFPGKHRITCFSSQRPPAMTQTENREKREIRFWY